MPRSKLNIPAEPTRVKLVYDALCDADDFMTGKMLHVLLAAQGVTSKHIRESLRHLQEHHAVENVTSEDRLWWYATPTGDDRARTIPLRTPEDRPRSSKGRAKNVQGKRKPL